MDGRNRVLLILRMFDIEYVFILSKFKNTVGNDAKSVTAQQDNVWLGKTGED